MTGWIGSPHAVNIGAWGLALMLSCSGLACGPKPPPHWASGGSPLVFTDAHWIRQGEQDVHLNRSGEVFEGDTQVFAIDTMGRVTDSEGEPFGVVDADGRVLGTDESDLGRLGLTNASPPDATYAWIRLDASGAVMRFASDGAPRHTGLFQGCHGHAFRSCTLVVHLFALRKLQACRSKGGTRIGGSAASDWLSAAIHAGACE
jgi:hypothetical protein